MIRLDRWLSACSSLTRSQASAAVREGRVSLNGMIVRRPELKAEENRDLLCLDGIPLRWQIHHDYLLNKPAGLITASRDRKAATVLDLFPQEVRKQGIFPVGRLDRDTEGLLLLTDDGDFAHRIISPRSGIRKIYEAETETDLDPTSPERFREGIVLKDGTHCLPAGLRITGQRSCVVAVQEGKYHQVRRMLAAIGSPVIRLRRTAIGSLTLPETLESGSWRVLEEKERNLVLQPLSVTDDPF